MADDLKKVGLIFKADGTVDFKKSLSDVNIASQKNRAEFKLAKAQWDENTKASEKLKVTNEYLTKQYEETARKVNILTLELEELESAEEKDEKAINKKRAALTSAQASMINYKKGMDETNEKIKAGTADLEDYAKKLDKTAGKAKSTGEALTKGLTVPITAIGAASMAAWAELDEAYDGIAAGTGATGEALSELQNSFDVVFGSLPVEAEAASSAIADINTRFGFTGDVLEAATEKFLKFAEVNNTDVSSAVALVSRAMGDASIKSSEYGNVLDSLTAASQASGISIEKLTEMLTKYGAPMRALGYDTKESIAIFSSWEKAGVNTEIAFSGMKKAISNFMSEGKNAKVEFKKLVEGIENGSISASEALEIFGTKAGPDLVDAIQEGRFSFEEMLKVVEGSSGQLEQTFDDMLDPADNAKIALNNLKIAGSQLGDTIQTSLGPVFASLAEIIKDITKWFNGLNDSTKTMIVVIGMLLAAIGPLIFIFGTLAGSVSKMITLYTLLKEKQILATIATKAHTAATLVWNGICAAATAVTKALGVAFTFLTSKTGLLILAIAGIITIVVLLIKNWEQVKQVAHDVWTSIQNKLQEFDNWMQNIFATDWTKTFGGIGNMLNGFFATTKGITDGIKQIFSGLIDFVAGTFTGDWSRAWKGVVNVFGGIMNTLGSVIKGPLNAVISMINWAIDGLNSISVTIPKWVPGMGGRHFGISIPKIPYLAKGGTLLDGMAMVAEAGPELLIQQGSRSTVLPLSNGGGATPAQIIDYDKMAAAFLKVMKYLSIRLDSDILGEFIDERIYKAVK